MYCPELAKQIQDLDPSADSLEVARLCLLVINATDDLDALLQDEAALKSAWTDAGLRLQAATDQHSAVTDELEDLAATDPKKFDREQIWVLLRAIKVQSQLLQMYIGSEVIDV